MFTRKSLAATLRSNSDRIYLVRFTPLDFDVAEALGSAVLEVSFVERASCTIGLSWGPGSADSVVAFFMTC